MNHFSYTKLYCLANNPTRFGARRSHPQGVRTYQLNFPTLRMDTNTYPAIYCRTSVLTPMHNFENFMMVASTIDFKFVCHLRKHNFKYY
jgi:hypothetical protein